MHVLLRAFQPGLFETQVPVKGHVTQRGTVVAPYQARRRKRPDEPVQPDLFGETPPKPEYKTPPPKPSEPLTELPPEETSEPNPYQAALDILEQTKDGAWDSDQITNAYLYQVGTSETVALGKDDDPPKGEKKFVALNPWGQKDGEGLFETLRERGNRLDIEEKIPFGVPVRDYQDAFERMAPDQDQKLPAILAAFVIPDAAKTLSRRDLHRKWIEEFTSAAPYEALHKIPEGRLKERREQMEKIQKWERVGQFFKADLIRYAAHLGIGVITDLEDKDGGRYDLIVDRRQTPFLSDYRQMRIPNPQQQISEKVLAGAKTLGFEIVNPSGMYGDKGGLVLKGDIHEVEGWFAAINLKRPTYNTYEKGWFIGGMIRDRVLSALENPQTPQLAYREEVLRGIRFANQTIPGFNARAQTLQERYEDYVKTSTDPFAKMTPEALDLLYPIQNLMEELFVKLRNIDDKSNAAIDKKIESISDTSLWEWESTPKKKRQSVFAFHTAREVLKMIGPKIPLATLNPVDEDRSWCSVDGRSIRISSKGEIKPDHIYHEIGHSMEDGNKAVQRLSRLFFAARVTDWTLKKLNKIDPGKGYRDDEWAYIGNTIDAYILKSYTSGCTEVISMGLERFASPERAADFFARDSEHFYLTLAAIGYNRGISYKEKAQ